MTAFGLHPRHTAILAALLAVVGAVAVLAGYFAPGEWLVVAALFVVAVVNWRRARRASETPSDTPSQ